MHEKIGEIKKHYWFPNMRPKIEKFVRNGVKCIMNAAPARTAERNFYSIPKKPIPFDTLHLDHFDPLPSLTSKRKYVLVVIDAFTKYVKLYSVNSTSTKEVTAALNRYSARDA